VVVWSAGKSGAGSADAALAIDWESAALTLQASSGDLGRHGIVDDAFVHTGPFDDASACRVCSCNLDGRACTRAGAQWLDRGRNATLCGGCALPPADQERPS
jgi:hypothetical protein